MQKISEINEIKKIVVSLGKQYGAERIFLFGSYAKGEANENSDIDLRIDRGDIRGLQMAALLVDIEDALGKKVDMLSTKCFDEAFLKSIGKDEILLYERQR